MNAPASLRPHVLTTSYSNKLLFKYYFDSLELAHTGKAARGRATNVPKTHIFIINYY